MTLYMDGQPVGNGRVDSTEAYTYSYDETTDVGCETGTTVSDDYRAADSTFTGTINWVRLEAGLDGHDHLLDPEHLTRIAMTRHGKWPPPRTSAARNRASSRPQHRA